MFWLHFGTFVILAAVLIIDWRRLRELIPAALAGILAGGLHLVLLSDLSPFRYVDTGPISNHTAISLFLQTTVCPAVAAWYAQDLKGGARPPLLRTAMFVVMSFAFSRIAQHQGTIAYKAWWSPVYSLVHLTLFYLFIWLIHTYCATADVSAKRPRTPEQSR